MTRKFALSALLAAATLSAQNNPVLGEETVKISDHVWAIMGWPNIGIVVGTKGVLVVDTGLGPRNGATIARVAATLMPAGGKLYLTTTHFHPEHAAGEAGFPAGTILVRDAVQQEEMEAHGKEMVELFAGRSPQNKELLAGTTFRKPDVTFDKQERISLGDVTVRLLWFGGAHTKGDELIFVEPDRTLITGDVVQNKVVPNIFRDGGTPASWLAVLDQVAALNPLHILPDHSAPGDGSMIAMERKFISELRDAALALKKKGVTADAAGTQLGAEFKAKYPDWPGMNVAGFVRSIYAE
jgi:glyoxylase-like metal-dependent hydrolase (beta-lactamase superfamily II)